MIHEGEAVEVGAQHGAVLAAEVVVVVVEVGQAVEAGLLAPVPAPRGGAHHGGRAGRRLVAGHGLARCGGRGGSAVAERAALLAAVADVGTLLTPGGCRWCRWRCW